MSREREGPPQLERKGGFPRKGMPMEEGAERELMRLRGEFAREKPDLVVTDKWFNKLPVLRPSKMGGPIRPWEPRYDRITGAVYTTKTETHPSLKITEEGKKAFKDARDLVVLEKPRYRKKVDLNKIPKSWVVHRIIPQEVWGGVTWALRQSDEIKHDATVGTGVEYLRVEELFVAVRKLFQKYSLGQVRQENLPALANDISVLLQKENILSARLPNLQVLEETLAAALRPDARGVFNPQAARLRIFKALRNLTMREIQTGLIARRADRVFRRMYIEWEKERFSLIAAREAIIELGRHPVWRRKRISDEEISNTRGIIKEIKNTLKAVRTAPFLLPARLVDAMLGSNQFRSRRDKDNLKKILEVGKVEGVIEDESVEDFLMKRETKAGLTRLKHVYSLIQAAIKDPDNYELTVFG